MIYWFNGITLPGIQTSADIGTLVYWFNGVPLSVIFTSSAPTETGVKVFDTTSPFIARRVNLNAY